MNSIIQRIRANKIGEPKPAMAVGALLIARASGRMLLQHRGRTSDSPLTWACFGGGVDEGENLKQALKREIMEECDFTGDMELMPLHKFTSDDGGFQYFTYIAIVDDEFTPIINHETENYKWFDPTKRNHYPRPMHPNFEAMLDMPKNWKRLQSCVNGLRPTSAE